MSVLLIILSFFSFPLLAANQLSPIEVEGSLEDEVIRGDGQYGTFSSDVTKLLEFTPGLSFQSNGGLATLPFIQGLGDDRINIKVDGANTTSSCSNHMNPVLSYIDTGKVERIEVVSGITPVSYGGDSLAGTILVKSRKGILSSQKDKLLQTLTLKSFFKSNNENRGASVYYSVASDKNVVTYTGLDEAAHNYRNGKGDRLRSTLYNQNNQSLSIGHKVTDGLVNFKMTHARVPTQGFVNQPMDMVDNFSSLYNLGYEGRVGIVKIDSTLYYQHTNHQMNILTSQRSGQMPMFTRSDELGYNLKAMVDLSSKHVMTIGSDYNQYRLEDYWPAVDGSMMMGPGTFQSIHSGKRDRLGLFVENDSAWSKDFTTNIGLRTDIVSMDTGNVEGYNGTSNLPADAADFNSRSHEKKDHNYDATFLANKRLTPKFDLLIGLGRKTRSPNLYERYAWAGTVTDPSSSMSAGMDSRMINWFGDGNGYVGNLGLTPEVAHKVSTSFVFHDESKKDWEVKITPYYSEVQGFIDADFIGSSNGANYLRFANHDAVLFGSDLGLKKKIHSDPSLGEFFLRGSASYTRGYRKDGKAKLYHMMPLNGRFSLEHELGKWKSFFMTELVDKKSQVNELRGEPTTLGYALFDLGTSYSFNSKLRIDFSITNLLDKNYALPLGGIDLVNYTRSSRTPVGGMGRSFNTALTYNFF